MVNPSYKENERLVSGEGEREEKEKEDSESSQSTDCRSTSHG